MDEQNLDTFYDGNFYHVCTNGLEQISLLNDEEDFKTAWNYLALSAWRTGIQSLAFVLMSNHIHEVVACKDSSQARAALRLYKKMLSLYLKNKYGLTKALRLTNDCVSVIDTVAYMKNCIPYILRNAVCARICAKPEDYKWSSYSCYFSAARRESGVPVSSLTYTQKRRMLKTGLDCTGCPFQIGDDGLITIESFVRYDIVESIYKHSGKSFLYYMGCCNDSRMEYELTCQPLMHISDNDMYHNVARYVASKFPDKGLPDLTSAEKCSILKVLFFNNKTTIPQLSRIMGLSRQLIRRVIST